MDIYLQRDFRLAWGFPPLTPSLRHLTDSDGTVSLIVLDAGQLELFLAEHPGAHYTPWGEVSTAS
jgi:hypothetical protein